MPPPVFHFTPPQRRALEALDWLHGETDDQRRTGRSTVLAMSYLRRLILHPRSRDSEWIEVEDHHSNFETDRQLVQRIQELAADMGFYGVEVRTVGSACRIRLASATRISQEVAEALTRFGELAETTLGLPIPPRDGARWQKVLPPDRESVPAPVAPDPVTLWDHLEDD